MTEQEAMLQQSSGIASTYMTPQEEALQALCKKLLKSRFFRGYYEERRFVDTVAGYRDIIDLHRGERDLELLLLDIRSKLQIFYQNSPQVWIGITHGAFMGITPKTKTLDTHIWVQLQEVAFGHYWFSIKSIRFRKNEVILKLNVVRNVEADSLIERTQISKSTLMYAKDDSKTKQTLTTDNSINALNNATKLSDDMMSGPTVIQPEVLQIGYEDFVNIVRNWGTTIKHKVYDFMSNDINKDNIKDFLQFLGLVVISLLTGSFVAIKYLGTFALRFMFEFTRFMHVMTPIILKIIEAINKIVGGFYILLAMIWKDAFMKRRMTATQQLQDFNVQPPKELKAIEYNRQKYEIDFEYNIRQPPVMRPSMGPITEFERKFQ
ncbi:PREDICTED: uncharacterized protein LOC108977514 [Bactrocera latifrons]|uniref:uncharacterized protein LOC108977514 n=1 Tax=Bactrocera latifrons TaxID=174628 RepID=UPI0008DDB553|nr:PREDICTED: uncharacterized protein LOC108977514 [Bactrocera latifrons]XP_018802781.1 PREDICTED: uncharacterized protein LOC108977514 [Bactrocera latifrons]XP_018802788.1 PREDICTED: uncharacterized protein LOC108977514 [Bactrocera latifrons]